MWRFCGAWCVVCVCVLCVLRVCVLCGVCVCVLRCCVLRVCVVLCVCVCVCCVCVVCVVYCACVVCVCRACAFCVLCVLRVCIACVGLHVYLFVTSSLPTPARATLADAPCNDGPVSQTGAVRKAVRHITSAWSEDSQRAPRHQHGAATTAYSRRS